MDFKQTQSRIFLEGEQGQALAYVDFPVIGENIVELTHTVVDDSLRGQGIAGKLMEAFYNRMKRENKKVKLSCSYAVKYFEKNVEKQDIIV